MIIYNFSIDTMQRNSRFLDLTAVNMQKNVFLAIFWICTFTNSIPLQLFNSLLRQLSNFLTLQLTSSPTHLLTYSPTFSTNGGSTSSSLVSFLPFKLVQSLQQWCINVCLFSLVLWWFTLRLLLIVLGEYRRVCRVQFRFIKYEQPSMYDAY